MSRVIHHTFAPLGDRRQTVRASKLLFQPWKWKKGRETSELKQAFEARFGGKAFGFFSGREALLAILRSLKLTPGEEVIVQGYTCIVVPNAILAAGCIPVYVDIDRDTLNLNVEDVEKAITPKTRAVICQHTFGIPADTEALRELCDKHSLLLIEDCAHVIPDAKGPEEIGGRGDVLFFSFGRDKAISGVAGGMAVSRDADLNEFLAREEEKAVSLPLWEIKLLLSYPLLYSVARPFYGSGMGKAFLAFCGKAGLLRPIVTAKEKAGEMPQTLRQLPNACAALALEQWKTLGAINEHRRALVTYYLQQGLARGWFTPSPVTGDGALPMEVDQSLPLQKFPMFVKNAEKIRASLKNKNIHLNDGWTNCVVCPQAADGSAACYVPGTDPTAEGVAESILSLPTHPGTTEKDARRLVEALDELVRI